MTILSRIFETTSHLSQGQDKQEVQPKDKSLALLTVAVLGVVDLCWNWTG